MQETKEEKEEKPRRKGGVSRQSQLAYEEVRDLIGKNPTQEMHKEWKKARSTPEGKFTFMTKYGLLNNLDD